MVPPRTTYTCGRREAFPCGVASGRRSPLRRRTQGARRLRPSVENQFPRSTSLDWELQQIYLLETRVERPSMPCRLPPGMGKGRRGGDWVGYNGNRERLAAFSMDVERWSSHDSPCLPLGRFTTRCRVTSDSGLLGRRGWGATQVAGVPEVPVTVLPGGNQDIEGR